MIYSKKLSWRGLLAVYVQRLGRSFWALLGVTLHNLGWLRRHLGYFWCFHLNDFGSCSKRHVLSQSISMMSCNVTVKLGRIHKDSDGSERRVCIRVCICICVCILYTAGCEVLMRSLQENSNFAVGTLVRVCIWVCICMARQSVNEWMSERVNEWMDELINGWMDGWRDA